MHLSYRRALSVKDETVHVVGKVHQCDFGLGAVENDGANAQASSDDKISRKWGF